MDIFALGVPTWEMALFLAIAGVFAGFVDSIVGGGGLVSVPAMLLTGLPPSIALGSNKCASVFGSLSASITFTRSKMVNWKLVSKQIPFTFVGSVLGSWLVIILPPLYVKPLLLFLLIAVAIFVFFKRDWGTQSDFKEGARGILLFCILFAFGIGTYDGFIGPGTGTFLIFAFIFAGFNFLQAAGNAKILNFTSNLGSLLLFISLGHVNFIYGGIMALGQFTGAQIGSRLAIEKGSSLVRVVFLLTTAVMILKLSYDYIQTFF